MKYAKEKISNLRSFNYFSESPLDKVKIELKQNIVVGI